MSMKTRLSLLLISLLIPLAMIAQSEHLAFKGIPIDGTLRQFSSKLIQKGFTKLFSENGRAVFQGDFAGYKDCYVAVETLDQKDLVYMVGVVFPDKDQWALLEGNYNKLKRMLTEKYGEPSEVIEEFQSGLEPKTDNEKYYKLVFDECTYKSVFETDKGRIGLTISHEGVSKCFVVLGYVDGINGELAEDAAMDDL